MNIRISGFSDEISNELQTQINVVKKLSMKYICFRSAFGKDIGEFSLNDFKEQIWNELQKQHIEISSIGSAIGKVHVNDEDGFYRHLAMLENICLIAKMVNCQFIRIFSFLINKDEDYSKYSEIVLEKLSKFEAIARKHNIILLHENEKETFGNISSRCKLLFENINSPHFKAIFDFANFVQCGDEPVLAYETLKPYVKYFHIKDYSKKLGHNVPCAMGDGQIQFILSNAILTDKFEGYLSLEPHLLIYGTQRGIIPKPPEGVKLKNRTTGEELFCINHDNLLKVLKEIGETNE